MKYSISVFFFLCISFVFVFPATAFKQKDLDKLLRTNECRKCDLSGVNLEGVYLKNAIILYSNLNGANLSKVVFNNVSLSNCNLVGVNFDGAILKGVNMRKSNLSGVDFSKVAKLKVSFSKANLQGVNLQGFDLRKVWLKGTNLQNANLKNTNLDWVKLRNADLRGADLRGASMTNTFIYRAKLDAQGYEYAKKHGAQLTHDDRIDSN